MAERLMEHILPSNATLYERVLASQVENLLELDTDRLRRLWDPYRCHIDDLPYLAWSLSVDIWDPDWPEIKKRNVVANAILHHRMKGTEGGMRAYLEIADSDLRKLVVPPARGFRIPSMTPDEFQSWLVKLPQIRIYPFVTSTPAGPRDFRMPVACFRDDNFREASLGPVLYGRRSTLYKSGVEVPVRVEQLANFGEAVERVFFAGVSQTDFRDASFRSDGYREPTAAAANVVTVRLTQGAGALNAVDAGLEPQTVKPVQIAERHTPPRFQHFHDFGKSFRGNNYRRETDAPLWIYDRIPLYGHDSLPSGLSARWYRGNMRYGIEAYTAQATVEIPMERSPARGFGGRFRNGFRITTDMTPLDDACGAIVASKSLRDTVMVDTVTHRVVRLGDRQKLGSFKLGEVIRVA